MPPFPAGGSPYFFLLNVPIWQGFCSFRGEGENSSSGGASHGPEEKTRPADVRNPPAGDFRGMPRRGGRRPDGGRAGRTIRGTAGAGAHRSAVELQRRCVRRGDPRPDGEGQGVLRRYHQRSRPGGHGVRPRPSSQRRQETRGKGLRQPLGRFGLAAGDPGGGEEAPRHGRHPGHRIGALLPLDGQPGQGRSHCLEPRAAHPDDRPGQRRGLPEPSRAPQRIHDALDGHGPSGHLRVSGGPRGGGGDDPLEGPLPHRRHRRGRGEPCVPRQQRSLPQFSL